MNVKGDVNQGIRILSFDSGGPGTYSQILVVKKYMSSLAIDLDVEEHDLYPADYFDLMGGVGFGGMVAMMLGHLRMNIEEVINAFLAIAEALFPHEKGSFTGPDARMESLQGAVEDMLHTRQLPVDLKLNDKRLGSTCKVSLYAATVANLHYPMTFRTYASRMGNFNPTVVEAICATMANPALFSPMIIGRPPQQRQQSFVGPALGANNPTRELLNEAKNIFGKDRRVAQVLSVGAGHPGSVSLNLSAGTHIDSVKRLVADMAMDCEMVAGELANRLYKIDAYLRLNVDIGMANVGLEDWSRLGAIESHTHAYVEARSVLESIESSLRRLRGRVGTVTLGQLTQANDIKLMAKATPAVSPHYILRKREQDIMLYHLAEAKDSQQKLRVFAITGMGGCGKTQMVSYFLQENQQLFDHIIFVDASSEASIKADLQLWARSLGDGHEQDAWEDGLRSLATGSHSGRWILILDNADDRELKLVPFFPKCQNGNLIITSRNRDVGNLANTYHLELGHMQEDEALSALLLAARRQPPLPKDELESARTLIKELGGLAVALVQASTYCRQLSSEVHGVPQPYTFTQYLALFYSQRRALMTMEGPSTLDDYPWGVYTTLDLSYHAIPLSAREFFHFVAQFHHSDISLAMLEAAAEKLFKDPRIYLERPKQHEVTIKSLRKLLCPDDNWNEVHIQHMVKTLRSFSLVSTTVVGDNLFLQLHPLVQAWARDMRSSSSKDYPAMARQILTSCCFKSNTPLYRYLRLHIDVMLDGTKSRGLHLNDQMAAGTILNKLGHYHDAEVLFSKALEILRRACGKETKETLSIAGQLAGTYNSQGRWKLAETLRMELLEKRRKILGKDDPDTIKAAGQLAATLNEQGRWSEAEVLKLEVLDKRRRMLGLEHEETIWAAASLAVTYQGQRRWEEAEKLEIEALTQRRRIMGANHLDTVWTAAQLAVTYREQGRWGEAEALQLQVLEQRRRILGKEHPETIWTVGSLASTYHAQGRWGEAESLQEEVLKQRRRNLGAEHPATITAATNLAITYTDQKRWKEAELLLASAVEFSSRIIGQHHPLTQERVRRMVDVYRILGKTARVEETERLLLASSKSSILDWMRSYYPLVQRVLIPLSCLLVGFIISSVSVEGHSGQLARPTHALPTFLFV